LNNILIKYLEALKSRNYLTLIKITIIIVLILII
jgi:hypothetical protein